MEWCWWWGEGCSGIRAVLLTVYLYHDEYCLVLAYSGCIVVGFVGYIGVRADICYIASLEVKLMKLCIL